MLCGHSPHLGTFQLKIGRQISLAPRNIHTNFYARKQNASRVLAIERASVCLSVTLMICIKTVQAIYRITKSSLWAAPKSLVYRDKISCHWVQGFPSNECVEEGYPPPLKWRHFAVTGSNNVKTVADRYIHAAYHNKVTGFMDLSTSMTLNDPEPLKKRFLVNFSQFLDAAHISTPNCDEMAGDRPKQPAYEIFSIRRRF